MFAAPKVKEEDINPLTYQKIGLGQSKDRQLRKLVRDNPDSCKIKVFKSAGKAFDLICHKDKIVIPKKQQQHGVDWYHKYLGHVGINRSEETIEQHLW